MEKDKLIMIATTAAMAYLILATAFYAAYYNHATFRERIGPGVDDGRAIYEGVRQYWDTDFFGYDRLHLISAFAPKEQSHLADVKKLIDWVTILYIISAIILAAAAVDGVALARISLLACGGCAGAIFIFGAWYLLDFNSLWEFLHRLLFQGNWMFPADSLMIRMFPPSLFQELAQRFIYYALIFSGLAVGLTSRSYPGLTRSARIR